MANKEFKTEATCWNLKFNGFHRQSTTPCPPSISGSPKKTLTRVEILKIAEPCPLIDPSQVVITQGEVLVADPVMTPIGSVPSKHEQSRMKKSLFLFLIKGSAHEHVCAWVWYVDLQSQFHMWSRKSFKWFKYVWCCWDTMWLKRTVPIPGWLTILTWLLIEDLNN